MKICEPDRHNLTKTFSHDFLIGIGNSSQSIDRRKAFFAILDFIHDIVSKEKIFFIQFPAV